MANTYTFLLAGFGGQGILFIGKVLAYAGLIDEKEVSWLPSYGPAMRGGTANCSVTVSDEPVGSPLVLNPKILLALNQPSFDAFEDSVADDGIIILDSSLISSVNKRENVKYFEIPATKLANENELKGLGNMIILGKLLKETGFSSVETVEKALSKCIPPKKQNLLPLNMKAIKIGFDF